MLEFDALRKRFPVKSNKSQDNMTWQFYAVVAA
jgi:hypothetical protein